LTEKLPRKKRTYPRATALVGGLLAGVVAGLIAYLIAGLAGFIIGFVVGIITGSQATLLSLRSRQQQP
jgi:predicted lipid-binding transport protein (Tim44 family)